MQSCLVCCETVSSLYSLCNCSHRFCENCCLHHISAKLQSFNQITCLQTKCKNKFDENGEIAKKISLQQKTKLKKFKLYKKISGNPNLRQCRKQGCEGIMDVSKKQKLCSKCKSLHCFKCFELNHEGECKRQDDSMMIVLNYRRCPQCRVWVQKSGGCQYLNCKCGVMFCFQCGVEFQYDPCRKNMYEQKQRQLKITLFLLKIIIPEGVVGKILFVPLLIIKLVFFIIITLIASIIYSGIIIIALPLISSISPVLLFFIIVQNVKKNGQYCCNCKCFLIFLATIILYPLITIISLIILIGLVVSYPIGRKLCPARIYDLFDEFSTNLSLIYIKIISSLFLCNN